MIKINLLDANMVKTRVRSSRGISLPSFAGGPMGNLLVGGTIVLDVVLNAGLGYVAWSNVHVAGKAFGEVKAQHDTIVAKIKEKEGQAAEIRQFSEVVNNQMDVLRSLDPPDRILWAEKMNMLSALVPKGVFLDQIEVNELVDMIETAQSVQAHETWANQDKETRGAEPTVVKRPVIHYQVRLTGVALGDNPLAQIDNVKHFQEALANYSEKDGAGKSRRFMDGFQPDIYFETVQTRIYPNTDDLKDYPDLQQNSWMFVGIPVNKFTFVLNTRSWGMDEEAKDTNKLRTVADTGAPAKKVAVAKKRVPRGEDE